MDLITYQEQFTADYSLGKWKGMTLLSGGFANKNFKLVTENGVYLYRLVMQKRAEELEEELEYLLYLKEHNFQAAFPVPKKDGTFINQLNDGTLVVLYDFLDGEEPEPNPFTASEIGKAAGQLNALSSEKWIERKNDLSLKKCSDLISRFISTDNRLKAVLNQFTIETEILSDRLRNTDLPTGIVHGDLYPDNTIFQGNKLIGILDFEEFCTDTLLFDVGNAIQGFCYPGKDLSSGCLSALLQAYHRQRPLNGDEIEMVPWYIRWGALAQVSWHLRYGLLSQFNDRQFNRVKELMGRITQLRKAMGMLEREVKISIKA